jgi:hypothetical protein
MEFYKVWKTRGGLIGVNKLTLGDVVGVQVVIFMLIIIMIAILVLFFPVVLFGIYILLMLGKGIRPSNYTSQNFLKFSSFSGLILLGSNS